MGGKAGEHRPHVAQGAVFAAKARHFSGYLPGHTDEACRILAGMSAVSAAELADDVAAGGFEPTAEPDYEIWRRRVRDSV
jgi:hypothetical protein